MRIAILKERAAGESRVAATPETVRKFSALGASVAVEAGAGASASIPDAAFADAGSLWDYQGPVAGIPAGNVKPEVLSCTPGTGNKIVATAYGPACFGDSLIE